MGKRIVKVGANKKGYNRTVNGKEQRVPYVSPYTREVDTADRFKEIEDDIAKSLFIEQLPYTHPDLLKNSKTMFWKPNDYWAKHMGETDMLGIDGFEPPTVKSEPDYGMPFQVVKYNGDTYVADEIGVYMKQKDYNRLSDMTVKDLAQELNIRNSSFKKDEYIRRLYEQERIKKDPYLQPHEEGWKVRSTPSYTNLGEEGKVSGAFAFAVGDKTYVTWPATKEAQEKYRKDKEKDERAEAKLRERIKEKGNKEAEEDAIKQHIVDLKDKKKQFPVTSDYQKTLDRDIEGWEKQLEKTKEQRKQALKENKETLKKESNESSYKEFSKQRRQVAKENKETLKKEAKESSPPVRPGWQIKRAETTETKEELLKKPGAHSYKYGGEVFVTWPETKEAKEQFSMKESKEFSKKRNAVLKENKETLKQEKRKDEARAIENKIVKLQDKREKLREQGDLKSAKEAETEINALYRQAEKDDLNLYTANP